MILLTSLIFRPKVLESSITKIAVFSRRNLPNGIHFSCRFSHNVKFLVTVEVKVKLQFFIAENLQFSSCHFRFHFMCGRWRRNCKGHTRIRNSCILSHKQMWTRFYTGICVHNQNLTCHCILYLASNSFHISIPKVSFYSCAWQP